MNIQSAKYKSYNGNNQDSIMAVIDGVEIWIPPNPDNRHYAAILEWEKQDGNEIAEAD